MAASQNGVTQGLPNTQNKNSKINSFISPTSLAQNPFYLPQLEKKEEAECNTLSTGNITKSFISQGPIQTNGGNITIGDTIYQQPTARRNSFLKKFREGALLAPLYFPQPENQFIPRTALAEQLDKINSAKTAITACIGMGGTGKTQLALNYARNSKFKLKAWFRAQDVKTLEQSFLDFARALGFEEEKPNRQQTIAYVKQKLAEQSDWLLVFDNVEQYQDIKDFLPEGGHIILTTRHKQWPQNVATVSVDVMTSAEALSLLASYTKREIKADKEAETLVRELGFLPIAIAQAGAYIKENDLSFANYMKLFEADKTLMLGNNSLTNSSQSVEVTLNLSLRRLAEQASEETKYSFEILKVCAYLVPDSLPRAVLFRWFKASYPNLNPAEHYFNQILNQLIRYSLIKKNENELSMHRLLQAIVRKQHETSQKDLNEFYCQLANALHNEFLLKTTLLENETRQKALFPHIKLIVGFYELLKNPSTATEQALSQLLTDIGFVYRLSDPKEAESYYTRALTIQKRVYGKVHAEVATTIMNLCLVLANLPSTPYFAYHLCNEALSIQEQVFGKNHIEVAKIAVNLGIVYLNLGEISEAIRLYERALAIQEREHGKDNVVVAITIMNLGNAYEKLGEYARTISFYQRALTIQERELGNDHIDIAKTVISLGNTYRILKHPRDAIMFYERALAILEQVYGKDHIQVAIIARELGRAYCDLKDPRHAITFYERGLAIQEHEFGKNHFEVVITIVNLGHAYFQLKDPRHAITLYERSLTILESKYGDQYLPVVMTLNNIGHAYRQLGDLRSAITFYERALATQERDRKDHFQVAITLQYLSLAQGDLGDLRKKIELLERALITWINYYGKHNLECFSDILSQLEETYASLKADNERDALLEQAIKLRVEVFGKDHESVSKLKALLTPTKALTFSVGANPHANATGTLAKPSTTADSGAVAKKRQP